MVGRECCEEYPLWIPFLSLLQTFLIYGIGLYVLSFFGQVPVILYLLYIMWMELHTMQKGCRNCAYYGKLCGLGRGEICGVLMKKGDKKFSDRKITWKDLIPDFLVAGFPLAAGIILMLAGGFCWSIAALLLLLILLATAGNAIIRGIVCARCKQRKSGCPAEQLFQKK